MPDILSTLIQTVQQQAQLIAEISNKLQQIEIGGGGTSIKDYQTGMLYKRNELVVDTLTETLYRVLTEYTSTNVADDCANGNLKLVGFESQVVTFDHQPTQDEIDNLPEDTIVAIYSPVSPNE